MKQDDPQFKLRIDPELRKTLKVEAEHNTRTLGAEIVARLRQSTRDAPNTTTAPTGQIAPFGLRMVPELRDRIEGAARASGRSMNAEIAFRLAGSFAPAAHSDGGGTHELPEDMRVALIRLLQGLAP